MIDKVIMEYILENQKTSQGNEPSSDSMIFQISPSWQSLC